MKRYDVVATTGVYEDDQGNTKYRNKNVGVAFENEKGLSMAIDPTFNPAGCHRDDKGRVWLKFFDAKPKEQNRPAKQEPQKQPPQSNDGFEDPDIPF